MTTLPSHLRPASSWSAPRVDAGETRRLRGGLRLGAWLLLSTVALAVGGFPSSARAQAVDDEDEVEIENPANRGFFVDDSNFDMWIFGNIRNRQTGQDRADASLKLRLAELEQTVALTEPQKKKLGLAARGDLKRFFDAVEVKRAAFQLVRNDQQKFSEFYQQIQPLQRTFQQGLFGDGSLFGKTLKNVLTPEQEAKFDELKRQHQSLYHRALLGRVVLQLDAAALDQSQRRRLRRLILDKTQPASRPANVDVYVVLHQLAQLPEDQLKPIFREFQWRTVSPLLMRAKGYQVMLKTQGMLPDSSSPVGWLVPDDDEVPPPQQEQKRDEKQSEKPAQDAAVKGADS